VAPTATATGSGRVSWRRWRPRRDFRSRSATHRPGTSKWNKIEHRLFSHITLNWRGRPLTSHEVVVKTIAATTTSGGLCVEAALDTGDYPTGVAISKQRFDALPLRRHATHSAWNYTLHPRPAATATQPEPVAEQDGPARRRQAMLGRLADSRLTGMTTTDLQQLAAILASAQAARSQQRYAEQRGGRARRAAGKLRGRPLFDDAARLLLTLVYQRQLCSMTVLADLLEVTDTCIASLVHETREVLEDHSYSPTIASMRFATAHDLLAFLDQDLRPARTAIIHTLSAPALTGISRQELHQLTQRLRPRQAAHAERRTHQRRGGPRQPGTRGGVFPQKISNSERVLLTVLHLRRLCTLDVLADALGDVSRSAIGNAVRDTRPILEQDGRIPPPAPIRYRTATELLTAATASRDTPTT
jgi:Rhodopirellula transposase DDE domain